MGTLDVFSLLDNSVLVLLQSIIISYLKKDTTESKFKNFLISYFDLIQSKNDSKIEIKIDSLDYELKNQVELFKQEKQKRHHLTLNSVELNSYFQELKTLKQSLKNAKYGDAELEELSKYIDTIRKKIEKQR